MINYKKVFYCASEGITVKHENAIYNKKGVAMCPNEHCGKILRTQSRNLKHQTIDKHVRY
jgi:hypothetical protein